MTYDTQACPQCGTKFPVYRNPAPTADIVIHDPSRGIVLIKRRHPPLGHALPGGFMEIGESIERTAIREAEEETGLKVELVGLLGVYSIPDRDPRRHTITTVFVAEARNPDDLHGGDDAAAAAWFALDLHGGDDALKRLPPLAFDHARILRDFISVVNGGRCLAGIAYPVPSGSFFAK